MINYHAYFKLSRPINVLLSTVSVIITAAFFTPFPPLWRVLFAMLCVGFTTAAGNAINDYHDVEIDKINKPERPLPSGEISKEGALGFAVASFILATLFSLFLGIVPLIISLFISAPLLYFYARSLKRLPIIGNVVVSLILAMTFIYAATVYGNVSLGYMPAVLAFFFSLIREMVKDIEDIKGDKKLGAKTMAIAVGENGARIIAGMLALVMLPIIPLPYILGIYGKWYFFISGLGCGLPLIIIMIQLLHIGKPVDYKKLADILKFDIIIGLLAILLGNL